LARFGLLDQNTREPDPGIKDSVFSIIYAAPRTELKELHILRDILMQKYGRDFSASVMENRNSCVSDRVVRKLDLATPSPELVDAYLAEIAKAYGVDWLPPVREGLEPEATPEKSQAESEINKEELEPSSKPPSSPPTGDETKTKDEQLKPPHTSAGKPPIQGSTTPKQPSEDDFEALTKRFAALKKR